MKWHGRAGFLAGIALFACVERGLAQVHFVDVSASAGIQPYLMADGMGGGVAAEDYDNDGDIDFFVPNGLNTADQLYRNDGNLVFAQAAAFAGLASTHRNRVALWFDYDNDGLLDLIVANDVQNTQTTYRLYHQISATNFQDVTVAAGLFLPQINSLPHQRGGLAAADINNDRFLDLIAVVWNGPIHLFLNDRDGTFSNISTSSGVGVSWQYGHQPMFVDLNDDGWQDIYVSVDFSANRMWLNQKNNTFLEIGPAAGTNNSMNDMGMTIGDFDNDADFDIYVTNIFDIDPATQLPEYNILLRNDSTPAQVLYAEIAQDPGFNVDNGYWGWGTTFADFNKDGWLDLAATNGWRSGTWVQDPSRLWMHQGPGPVTFVDHSNTTGFNDVFYGSCLLAADLDRDGDLDMIQSCQAINDAPSGINHPSRMRVLRNDLTPPESNNQYLVVKPRINGPNRWAIGAIVRISAGGLNMMRQITAGTSYLGQEPAEAFFGLGTAPIESLTIEWPDGSVSSLSFIAANQVLTVTHGGYGDLNADGDVDDADTTSFAACYTGSGSGTIIYAEGCRSSDMNGDGDVDCDDWSVMQSAAQSLYSTVLPGPDLIAQFLAQPAPTAGHICIGDFNGDGSLNGHDVQAYVNAVLGP